MTEPGCEPILGAITEPHPSGFPRGNRDMSTQRPYMDPPALDSEDAPEPKPGATPTEQALFVLGAVRRHKALATVVFLFGIAATAAYYLTRTPMYEVETKIFAQRQQALPSIVRPTVDDTPTRTAWDLVHQRDNLINVLKQTKVLDEWRASASSTKGGLRSWLGPWGKKAATATPSSTGTASPENDELVNTLVLRLDKALIVTTGEGTITIAIDWPDPQQAYRLVEAALQNFLEARHVQEITAIDGVISLLQGRVAALRAELDKVIEESRRGAAQDTGSLALSATPRTAQPAEDLVRLKALIDAKERAIRDVEEFRRRRLADLQAQLDEKRAVYSDAYPGVISLRQDIAALSRESPQIAGLREEDRKLHEEYAKRLGEESPATPLAAPRTARRGDGRAEQDERVREARSRYDQMVERMNAAQLDLDAARAAFKFRYNVVWPAQVPKQPVSPNPKKILGLGGLASLLLALCAATAADLWAGRVVERWQVERALDLPVIADVPRR